MIRTGRERGSVTGLILTYRLMHERKRLHISPFTPELLPIILPPHIFQHATNISFHTIQTSPDRNYGYVDLPAMDAGRLKKKLNGSILKGSKTRVEDARPEKMTKKVEDSEISLEDGPIQESAGRRRRREEKSDGVILGVELPEGRRIRRGWTEPPSTLKGSNISKSKKDEHEKKQKPKPSSFTTESECLFRTKLLPNATVNETVAKKRKRDPSSRDVVVHEFANTKKHASFLRANQVSAGSKHASEYVEGKGWIDRDGNVLEAPLLRRGRWDSSKSHDSRGTRKSGPDTDSKNAQDSTIPSIGFSKYADHDDETSSSGTSSSSESEIEGKKPLRTPKYDPDASSESIADTLGSEDSTSDADTVANTTRGMSINRSSPKIGEQTRDPQLEPGTEDGPADEIHPLEAMFKKPNIAASRTPQKPTLEVSTSFNFFAPDIEEGTDTGLLMPHTPFTQQDFRQRRQRSAAPTPDTAAPGRTFENVWVTRSKSHEDDDDEDDVDDDEKASPLRFPDIRQHTDTQDDSGEKTESDFSKWFWEHRGETNRAWKRRRREATKEKRQKENKRN